MRALHLNTKTLVLVTAFVATALPLGRLSAQSTTLTLGTPYNPADLLSVGPFGKAADPSQASLAIGQTFTRPLGSTCAATCFLQGFSFQLGNDPGFTTNAPALKFRAYLATWDGSKAGAVLYSSNIVDGPTALSQLFTFSTPNIAIGSGTQYVAFLSAVGLFGSIGVPDATASVETVLGTDYQYAGGAFVYSNSGTTLAGLSTNAWDYTGDSQWQTRFTATFATGVVPEPSTLILMASGAVVLLGIARRRSNARDTA